MSNDKSVSEFFIFKDAMTGAPYIDADPHSCILFLNIREVARTGTLYFL